MWLLIMTTCKSFAQDSSKLNNAIALPDKLFSTLDKKASFIESKLDRQTVKYLSKLQRQERKLYKKLLKKDSLLARQLFEGVEEKYARLSKTPGNISKYASVYSGHLDSLTTSLNFLKDRNLVSSPELQNTLSIYNSLQSKLNQADNIKKYLGVRQRLLKQQLQNLGMLKELKGFQKQSYYYQAQVREYKELWENPSKIEQKLMELVMKVPEFKEFFASNSVLGSLFSLPGSSSAVSSISLAGLQTRASVNQSLIDRFGSGPNTTQMLQQNTQSAQAELSSLKNKINQYSSGSYGNSSDDIELPEGFKPNNQKTKSLFERLEYGANVQTGRGSSFFPVTSDLGLSLGYKISDKSSIGVGASYKLGWGSGWDHIKITHQGVGLRSYIDMKLKRSLYISGGYEQNYRSLLKDLIISSPAGGGQAGAWQSSGLVGLSKKYKLKGRVKGEMKLLWDFLSYSQVPRTTAVLFRVGYSLK
jgi:hypothetical protein